MEKFIRILLILLLSGSFLIIGSYFYIMSHLIVDEEARVSDVIIVPEGEVTVERAQKASELLDAGYSKSGKIIVAPLVPSNARYYRAFGVAEDQIINENQSASTYENAVNTLALMDELGYQSAIITSSDYHMNRVKMVFDRVNQDYGFDLTYVAAYHENEDGQRVTWREADSDYIQNFAQNEFVKTIAYWLRLYQFQ